MRYTLVLALGLTMVGTSMSWAAGAPVRIDGGDTFTTQADLTVTSATAVLVGSSNANRAALNCTTDQPVRWGSSAVTPSQGQRIPAGAAIEIHNTGAVYMIAESLSAVVSCTQEVFSASSSSGIFSP